MVQRVVTICDSYKLKLHFRKCSSEEIAVYIMFKGERLSICHECWKKLAPTDFEWGSSK